MQLLGGMATVGALALAVMIPRTSAGFGAVPSSPPDQVSGAVGADSVGEPPATATRPERCVAPDVRPTYLPWLKPGEEVPPPRESYDEEINRAQLSWQDPGGETGVGLTVYPLPGGVALEEPIAIWIYGVEGQLHRLDEGGVIGIHWDVQDEYCNFVELSLYAPGLPIGDAVNQLLKVARSLL